MVITPKVLQRVKVMSSLKMQIRMTAQQAKMNKIQTPSQVRTLMLKIRKSKASTTTKRGKRKKKVVRRGNLAVMVSAS